MYKDLFYSFPVLNQDFAEQAYDNKENNDILFNTKEIWEENFMNTNSLTMHREIQRKMWVN